MNRTIDGWFARCTQGSFVVVEDSPHRWRWSQRNRARVLCVLVWLALAVALIVTADVVRLRCDRARDRCDFASYQLVAETHEGHVALSQVNYLVDTRSVTRTASRGTLTRAQLRFVLRDGQTVAVEPESRTALVSDGIIERFNTFRLHNEPEMERWALHLGHWGLAALFAMFAVIVPVIVGVEREIELDFAGRILRVRVAGLRLEAASFECSFDEVAALETVASGPMVGVWLALRSGRRAQIDFESSTAFCQTFARRFGVAVVPQSSEHLSRSGARTRRAGAVALALFGAAPLVLAAAWPWVEGLL